MEKKPFADFLNPKSYEIEFTIIDKQFKFAKKLKKIECNCNEIYYEILKKFSIVSDEFESVENVEVKDIEVVYARILDKLFH